MRIIYTKGLWQSFSLLHIWHKESCSQGMCAWLNERGCLTERKYVYVTPINRLGNLPSNTQVENTDYANDYFESVIPYSPRQALPGPLC